MTDQNAAMNGVLSAIRTLLITLGTGLVSAGVLTKESPVYFWIMTGAGLVLVVGPAAWGVWVAIQHALSVRDATTKGVQAGINLTVAGEALTADGKKIPGGTGYGSVLPVTPQTAQAIVQKFGVS